MSYWFWQWVCFSFFGYLLEKAYAALTHAAKRNRKCFLFLPLCPVYGLAVTAMLALPDGWLARPWLLLTASALLPCAAEYGLHLYYERFFRVRYWDYRQQPLNLHGRVCLPFALIWTALMPLAVVGIAPRLTPLMAAIPPGVTLAAWLLLAADWYWSRVLLLRCGDTERLHPRALREL